MYIIVLSLIVLIDQASKYLIRHNLVLGQSLPVIKNIFHLSLVHNTGAAFGMFRSQTVFFILAACITIIAIIINLRFKKFTPLEKTTDKVGSGKEPFNADGGLKLSLAETTREQNSLMGLSNKIFDLERFGLVLILAGAVGNLIDRVTFSYVIDFLDFRVWPVFNVADSSISIGAFLLVIAILRESKK